MEATEPIFLGLDLAGVLTLPTILMLFLFAVWFGVSQNKAGIDAAEQERRMDERSASRRV